MRLPFIRRKLRGPFADLYDEARLPDYRRKGLNWMMMANIFGTLQGLICMGGTAAMVGLAGSMGATDLEFGLLVSIPQIAALLQLPYSILVNHTHKRKIYLLTLGIASRVLWMIFGFLPLIFPDSPRRALDWLIWLLALSSCMGSVINVCWFPWFSDMAPIRIRGRWLSIRDTMTSIGSLLFGLVVAYMLDVLPENSRYWITFLIGGFLGTMDMVSFGFVREEWSAPKTSFHIGRVLKETLRNKPFMRLVIMWTAWCFTANFSGAYLTPYSMNSMGLNFMQIMIFGTMAASFATVLAVPRWGRAVDQFGARNVMLVSCIGASLTPAFYLLATPGNVLPTLLHNVVGALFWSGSNLAANSMQLSSSPDETRPTYIALFGCMTALAGTALGTMAGGTALEWFHQTGWFHGFFDRYKAVILLSVIMRFGITLLLVPPMENDREGTVREMLRALIRGF